MNLPPELLRHIFSFIEDVECFDTVGFQPSSQRYQFEVNKGRKNIQTKATLLSVSWQFYQLTIELAWSWISIYSDERLLWMDSVIAQRAIPASLNLLKVRGNHKSMEEKSILVDIHTPALWIRRLDVNRAISGQYDSSPIPPALARIIQACSNLRVFVSDFTVGVMDCQRTSPLILDALKTLKHLTRLEFSGHEGPSLLDYIDLLPHLGKLEQWMTGRIAPPKVEEEQLVDLLKERGLLDENIGTIPEETRTRAIVLPHLTALQVSHRPLYSCLRLIAHMDLPSLTHISFRHLDFHAPRMDALFSALGHQFMHLSTHDIRTPAEPFGHAHILAVCPNIQSLIFSPRLRDDRYQQDWKHPNLRVMGLRSVLPTTIPEEPQLAKNIGLSLESFLERVLAARASNALESLTTIRIEDASAAALVYQTQYGNHWNEMCHRAGVRLEDAEGRRIPSELPLYSKEESLKVDIVEESRETKQDHRMSKLWCSWKRILRRVTAKVWKWSK